ncbi:MAG: hypothetical protein JWO11_2771 [Nocardioides sp.]|nr:hypothetical protein [Nocardioides sp.]
MYPTDDTIRALARSSPWRWTTLHFRHRGGYREAEVEAWVRRPGNLLVRTGDGQEHRVSGVPYGRMFVSTDPDFVRPVSVPPQQVEPTLRPDGLVAERPASWDVDYDDPMWGNYRWVAMLDPVELSHHVAVADPRVDEVAGRPVWRSFLRAEEGYSARCGGNCCELLFSDVSRRCEFDDPGDAPPARPGTTYPDCYDVSLDQQTGVVVRCHPVGGDADSPWLEVDILDVDTDLDELFPSA